MDVFYKNSLYVVPNAFCEYYDKDPLLKAYLEIYNAKKFAPKGYNIYFSIYDSYDQEIFTSSGQTIPISDGMVEIAEMPLDLVPTGKYSFRVKVAYPMDKESDSIIISKVFFNINSKIPIEQSAFVENESFEISEFSTMAEERLDLEFSMAKYLMTSTNMEQFDKLSTLEARQRYLFSFWKGLDPNPNTRANERYEDFKVAAAYANKFFSFANRKGWKTDRGRVLMTYGFPTQRDQVHQNTVEKSHEIWYYDEKEGGLTFAFVDIRGIGDFILVHSTYFSEIYNPNWYKEYVPVESQGKQMYDDNNGQQR
jgi:GWxTD domain-containing protein